MEWTWIDGKDSIDVAGSYSSLAVEGNIDSPGSRYESVSWFDSSDNTMWLFGGYGRDGNGKEAKQLNDLWKYNPQTGNWTWMSGFKFGNSSGIYGLS